MTKTKPRLGAVDLLFSRLSEHGFGDTSVLQRIMDGFDYVHTGFGDFEHTNLLALLVDLRRNSSVLLTGHLTSSEVLVCVETDLILQLAHKLVKQ